mmetsp:Transcript_3530/g.4911  ORF Transcript_3530/g.4911 Transcript_3530/m.4911 type:complete len:397 (+) Transcript_3530:126-1316(+)
MSQKIYIISVALIIFSCFSYIKNIFLLTQTKVFNNTSVESSPNVRAHLTSNDGKKNMTSTKKTQQKKKTKIESLSYSYSNCPFQMAKFSQYHLSNRRNTFNSKEDRLMNSTLRAKKALELSNNANAYDRVSKALKKGAFNRTVILEGDSLTRQFFISLGCLAWSEGFVQDYSLPLYVSEGGSNTILKNADYKASSILFVNGHIQLKNGGQIYYISNPKLEIIRASLKHMNHVACENTTRIYEARYNFPDQRIPLSSKDVVVLAAGHHAERDIYISGYKKFFSCIHNARSRDLLKRWPHFLYQLSAVESFWTVDGLYGSEHIPNKDFMSCQPSIPLEIHRDEERNALQGLVPFLADDINMKDLGEYHVQHGDCLHWIQPGVPDIYAAQLADYLVRIL